MPTRQQQRCKQQQQQPLLLPPLLLLLLLLLLAAAASGVGAHGDGPDPRLLFGTRVQAAPARRLLDAGASVRVNASSVDVRRGAHVEVSVVRGGGSGGPAAADLLLAFAVEDDGGGDSGTTSSSTTTTSSTSRTISSLPVALVQLALADPQYLKTGRARVAVRLANSRQPGWLFQLAANASLVVASTNEPPPPPPAVVAESAVVRNAARGAPAQLHAALHADGRSLVVQWVSRSAAPQQLLYRAAAAPPPKPCSSKTTSGGSPLSACSNSDDGADVDPATEAALLAFNTTAAASSSAVVASHHSGIRAVRSSVVTYGRGDLCGAPATTIGWADPGYLHAAVVAAADVARAAAQHADGVARFGYRVVGGGDGDSGDDSSWSRVHWLRAPPAAAPLPVAAKQTHNEFTFLAFADVGCDQINLFNSSPPYAAKPGTLQWDVLYTANASKLARALPLERAASLALLVGDLSYSNGVAADLDAFGELFEPAFSRWPLAVAMGNHERLWPGTGDVFADAAYDSGGECGVPTAFRYYTPATWRGVDLAAAAPLPLPLPHPPALGAGGGDKQWLPQWLPQWLLRPLGGGGGGGGGSASAQQQPLTTGTPPAAAPAAAAAAKPRRRPDPRVAYYSFDAGGVHFLVLDSETSSALGTPQHAFAAADLAAVDRAATPWVVVALHRQVWGPTAIPSNVANMRRLQGDYEALFVAHGVDLVLSGHDHAAARTCALRQGVCVDDGGGSSSSSSGSGSGTKNGSKNGSGGGSGGRGGSVVRDGGAPVYLLLGHGGAGFTPLPDPLPPYVRFAARHTTGYVRATVNATAMVVASVAADDGSVMDEVTLVRSELEQRHLLAAAL